MKKHQLPVLSLLYNSILPTLIGVLIYALFRGLYFIDPTGEYFPLLSSENIPSWILYNLPDGLWLYALLSAVIFVWGREFKKELFIWILLLTVVAISTEIFQLFNVIRGTYDVYDIIAYVLALLIFLINFKIIRFNFYHPSNYYYYENN